MIDIQYFTTPSNTELYIILAMTIFLFFIAFRNIMFAYIMLLIFIIGISIYRTIEFNYKYEQLKNISKSKQEFCKNVKDIVLYGNGVYVSNWKDVYVDECLKTTLKEVE